MPADDNTIPRPEYPRPQMVRGGSSCWLNLNGEWEFELDPGGSGEERKLHQGGPFTGKITVPFCPESELSGVGNTDFMPCVWYRRQFNLPESRHDKRII
ncbi:MAG: beta-galactosidase, partial [Gemmatimonadota bacterium]|nr:beta-galactosidase [Gemmatimonadota bacterium]